MDRPIVRDIVFVIPRLIPGIIFICHGWDKAFITGADKMTGCFVAANIPQVHLAIWVATLAGLVRGASLVLGLLTSAVVMVFTTEMIDA